MSEQIDKTKQELMDLDSKRKEMETEIGTLTELLC